MIKICSFCGNKNFREKHVQYIYKHDDQFLVVDNVPCEECEYCGEQYFEAKALKRLKKISKPFILPVKKPKGKLRCLWKNLLNFRNGSLANKIDDWGQSYIIHFRNLGGCNNFNETQQ